MKKKSNVFNLTRVFFTIMILGFMFTTGRAYAAFIVNIDATTNGPANPVVVYMNAGTYNVTPIGIADGGAYNAWLGWSVVQLPDKGWLNQYTIDCTQWSNHKFAGTSLKYATDLEALSDARGLSFTLAADGEVIFWLSDPNLTDNTGGMSLLVTALLEANAGNNLVVTSETLASTVINGYAHGPYGDSLTYRWREGSTILLDWQPVGPQGQAILNLGSISPLTIGKHTLTLEVSDGARALTATDDTIIFIRGNACTPFIVDIDAHANGPYNPLVVSLTAGTYSVTPIGIAAGGAYNAWNGWGVVALPDKGWMNKYWINSTQWSTHQCPSTNLIYATDLEAFSNAISTSFTLAADGEVIFYFSDPYLTDDIGGMSLLVTRLLCNEQPIANAGPDMSISSEDQDTTIIHGTASDPEGDPLSYRWLEGNTVLVTWQPLGLNNEAYLYLLTVPLFSIGQHTLTLEVNDGHITSASTMNLIIQNSAPHPAPTGGGIYEIFAPVLLGGQVSDFDGDVIIYQWLEGAAVLYNGVIGATYEGAPVDLPFYEKSNFSLGTHEVTLRVDDGVNPPVSNKISIKIIDTTAPTLSPIPNKTILWPPNHKMVNVAIETLAGDNTGGPVTLSAQVLSNEPQDGLGDGDTSPDWTVPVINQATGIITLQLRAERSGAGDGRVYTIRITAADASNNTNTADAKIYVPHDKGKN